MAEKPQKPVEKLTTEEAMKRLFPREVIEEVRREVVPRDTGGPGDQKPRSKSMPKA